MVWHLRRSGSNSTHVMKIYSPPLRTNHQTALVCYSHRFIRRRTLGFTCKGDDANIDIVLKNVRDIFATPCLIAISQGLAIQFAKHNVAEVAKAIQESQPAATTQAAMDKWSGDVKSLACCAKTYYAEDALLESAEYLGNHVRDLKQIGDNPGFRVTHEGATFPLDVSAFALVVQQVFAYLNHEGDWCFDVEKVKVVKKQFDNCMASLGKLHERADTSCIGVAARIVAGVSAIFCLYVSGVAR